MYVMADFICTDLLTLQGARRENYKMKNSLPTAGHELTALGLRSPYRYH